MSLKIADVLDAMYADAGYVASFKNKDGEVAVFVRFHAAEVGLLLHQDNDWREVEVVDGFAQGIVLHGDEQMWLSACWGASG